MNRIVCFVLWWCSFSPGVLAQQPLQLWYERPAAVWEETLPLGSGRLAMMPDGSWRDEKIVLNEITLVGKRTGSE